MKFIPILFSTPMVIANLEKRKTQTRRILKPQPKEGYTPKILIGHINDYFVEVRKSAVLVDTKTLRMKYGQPGDILWVRENFVAYPVVGKNGEETEYEYQADRTPLKFRWKPSIHMPKVACRLFLKVKSVRVERLQDISEQDAVSEGSFTLDDHFIETQFPEYFAEWKAWSALEDWETVKPPLGPTAKQRYEKLWQAINGPESWDANPWVWVVEYEKIEKPTGWPNQMN